MSHGLVTDQPITRDELVAFRDAPTHVIGAASAEGVAVLRLLAALAFSDLIVHDMRERSELRRAFRTTHGAYDRVEQELIWKQLRGFFDTAALGDTYLTGIEAAQLVVLPQGWYLDPHNREQLVAKIQPNARIVGMTELYFALHRGPIAGVTGTNGKSTTVALIDHLLASAGVTHRTAGNERSSRQFLPEIDNVEAGAWALLEVSNRQLLQLSRGPQVAAITALTPDHLEEHGGWQGYCETKGRLFSHQLPTDIAIVNADDPAALEAASTSPAAAAGRLVLCGIASAPARDAPVGDRHSIIWHGDQLVVTNPLVSPAAATTGSGEPAASAQTAATHADVQLPGDHNLRNTAVAVAVALACGAPIESIAPALRTFVGKSLRLESMGQIDGVEVWSDIKSTTPEATQAALQAVADRRVAVIVGGDDKGLSYTGLAAQIAEHGDRILVLAVPGSATDKLWRELDLCGAPEAARRRVERIDDALDQGLEWCASGDAVIVSPAAAGFWTAQLQGKTSLRSLIRQRVSTSQGVTST